ncbi:MAG: hypothetical protein M3540_13165, partial [Actinomycetota bacterium]|nr:hypothetical protein [Actinomycetota bacterium]
PGEWVEAEGELESCRNGIHACRPTDLPGWIDDELWEIELDGPVKELPSLVVAARGRLVRRIESWDDALALEFATACAQRARVEEPAGAPAQAAAFAADAVALVQGRRPEMWEEVPDLPPQSPSATAANLGFVVAHAAGSAAAEGSGDPAAYQRAFDGERTWQLEWLTGRLGI